MHAFDADFSLDRRDMKIPDACQW
jgi:hypothetical protein